MSEKFDLAKELAKRVTVPDQKDIKIVFNSERGWGMSYAGLSLAEGVAKIAALRDKETKTVITVQESRMVDPKPRNKYYRYP